MESIRCHKCERTKVKLSFCSKIKEQLCWDCCVNHNGGIGKCGWHRMCWKSFF